MSSAVDAPNRCLAVLMEPGVDGAHLCHLLVGHEGEHHCDACELTWPRESSAGSQK